MNLIDKVVASVDPVRAIKRWQARQALAEVRSFDAAAKGRRTSGWKTPSTSANAENLGSIVTLRDRSRDLVRNNAWVKRALDTWVGDAIGTGVRATLESDPAVGAAWKAWADSSACDADGLADLYGLQALAARCAWEAGEVLIRRRWRRSEDGLPVPMQLQVLEPDHLDHTKTESLKNGGQILGGVEFDALGRRVAYWLFDLHPGEHYRLGRSLDSRRVDAIDVIHLFKRTRPGQVRGVPELAPVILRARDLDDYEDAELTRKKVEACFAVFVKTDGGAASGVGTIGKDQADRSTARLSPGMIKNLRPGEDVTFASPTPTAGYTEFTRGQLRAMAAGSGVTYEAMSGDLSQVNYSSMRAGQLAYRRSVEAWQWLVFVPMFCKRIEGWFIDAAELSGKRRSADAAAVDWSTPRWEWVDPVKDMKGELLKIAAGTQSFSELIRRQGSQPDVVLKELADDWKKLSDLGIPISLDGLVSLASAPIEGEGFGSQLK